MIYLDNSATTRLDAEVLDAMLPWLRDGYGNASSIYRLGREARVAVEQARTDVAHALGAHPAEITFTSGGTEANNAILKSCIETSDLADALAVGATEHHAVLAPSEELAHRGTPLTVLSVDGIGRVDLEAVRRVNGPRVLVSVMHANNETGIIQPIADIRRAAPDVLLHADAVQSFGKIAVNVATLGVDFLSMSAHKIHGPKGVGAMFIRKGIDFKAHQQGGGQERNRRAGTEPVALIVGFVAAVNRAVAAMDDRAAVMRQRIERARRAILDALPDVRVNTPDEGALPNILNVSFRDAERLDGEAILQMMDIRGIAVSNGSACVSGSLQPSHVLSAMGLPSAEAKAAVRISVSKDTTEDEIDRAVAILAEVVRNLRV